MTFSRALLAILIIKLPAACGFAGVDYFNEQSREEHQGTGVRIVTSTPGNFDPAKPTLLVIYAVPNGNTIEQTLGCKMIEGLDWHYDIQHIAAQTRRLREIDDSRNIVLACVEADGKSWPGWRAKHRDNGKIIRGIVDHLAEQSRAKSVALTAHSGGGSFIFGYLNGGDAIEDRIDRIAWLDANYAYSDADHHGEKLLAWLRSSPQKHLIVLAYDDRKIELNGKPVLKNPLGGTYGSTHRMIDFFNSHETPLAPSRENDFETFTAMTGQIHFFLHPNPENKILHTILVGEMNGFLHALTLETLLEKKWGVFGGPRAYTQWIQPATRPAATRATTGPSGVALMQRLASLPLAEREDTIFREISAGNYPQFLRNFKTIKLKSANHTAEIRVMPDYLAVGSDDDFVRIPMLPATAQKIADALKCSLPTRKLVDEIYRAAEIKLTPQPLTEKREAVETFLQHHRLIEDQRGPKPLGQLIAGIKKDIVVTPQLKDHPHKVAIYGWHQPDGKPIQGLYVGHKDTYVDYSHGVRLIDRKMIVDGKEMAIEDVLKSAELSALVSDEGPIDAVKYPP